MKKAIALSIVAAATMAFAGGAPTTDDLRSEIEALKKEIAELKKAQQSDVSDLDSLKKQFMEVKAHDAGDNIKWTADLRSSYDYVGLETVNGTEYDNDSVLSTRLQLGMAAKATDKLTFQGTVVMNKIWGVSSVSGNPYNNMDWYMNETPDDGQLRIKEANFFYFGDMGEVPYVVSVGRRPSTEGLPLNLREDDDAGSPLSHIINMEYDGASIKWDLDKLSGVSGMYFKICAGRGYSNTDGKFQPMTAMQGVGYGYSNSDIPNMDLIGFVFEPYNNGQYQVTSMVFRGINLQGDYNPTNTTMDLNDLGSIWGGAITAMSYGIGDGINNFLDDTTAFVSFAAMQTDPDNGGQMLGSPDKKTGTSWYVGVQMPVVITDDGRFGLEYNHGSKYWQPFTYGEDTIVGSKLAARGDAYEAYWTQPLVGKNLSAQLRYTYINYDYTGSGMFYGYDGMPMSMSDAKANGYDPVEKAQDIRFYVRYRY